MLDITELRSNNAAGIVPQKFYYDMREYQPKKIKVADILRSHRIPFTTYDMDTWPISFATDQSDPSLVKIDQDNFDKVKPYHVTYRIGTTNNLWAMLVIRLHDTDPEIGTQLLDDVIAFFNENVLSNGTPQGQIGRYVKVREIHKTTNFPVTREQILSYFWKFAEVRDDRSTYNDLSSFTVAHMTDTDVIELLRINAKADCGYPFIGLRREDVAAIDMELSDFILAEVCQAPKTSTTEIIRTTLVGKCKPKFEVSTIQKMNVQTRNIQVLPSYLSLVPGILGQLFMKCVVKLDDKQQHSLLDYSFQHGGLNTFLEHLNRRLESKDTHYYYYSDNVFYIRKSGGRVIWWSMDGMKMEGSARVFDTRVVVRYALSIATNLSEDELDKAADWIVEYSLNVPVVLETCCFIYVGLASGSQWTTLINHLRMSYLAPMIFEKLDLLETFDINVGQELEILQQLSIPVRLDCTLRTDITTLLTVVDTTNTILSDEVEDFLPGMVTELDLLGNDACIVHYLDRVRVFPCLAYKRLLSMMCFIKAESSMTPLMRSIYTTIVALTCYMVGGYAYPAISQVIHDMYNLVVLENEDEFTMDQDQIESMSENLSVPVPLIETMYRMMLSKVPISDYELLIRVNT